MADLRSSPAITARSMRTKDTHASVERGCAWVMAETALISSSVASVQASGAILIREPLPLSRSSLQPCPCIRALVVVLPMPNAFPSGVYAPSRNHAKYRFLISSTSTRPHVRILSRVASSIEVSSENVPFGIWSASPLVIPLQVKVSRFWNS